MEEPHLARRPSSSWSSSGPSWPACAPLGGWRTWNSANVLAFSLATATMVICCAQCPPFRRCHEVALMPGAQSAEGSMLHPEPPLDCAFRGNLCLKGCLLACLPACRCSMTGWKHPVLSEASHHPLLPPPAAQDACEACTHSTCAHLQVLLHDRVQLEQVAVHACEAGPFLDCVFLDLRSRSVFL